MKNRKLMIGLLSVMFVIVATAVSVYFLQKNQHADIDQWSSQLIPEKIGWAQVSKEYGIESRNYMVTKEEYPTLIALLNTVTEEVSSRTDKERRLEDGSRLALFYDGKLWVFKCCEDKKVSLMFEDFETGAYYGCEGSHLYIDSPELWDYIKTTADEKTVSNNT